MIRRMRFKYWSESKLSHKLREKFGLTNPQWNTWEGWEDHRKTSKNTAPFIHWLTSEGFNKAQNIVMFPADFWWAIKTATIWKFFRNLWLFRKGLWEYRSWDYHGMLEFMETSARDMSRCHKEYGQHTTSHISARELEVWANLIKRIKEDTYTDDKLEFKKVREGGIFGGFDNVQRQNTLPCRDSKQFYKIIESNKKNDLELIGKMFSRKVRHWWS